LFLLKWEGSGKWEGEDRMHVELFLELLPLATRAFDYAVIVNRNESIIIPAEATSRQMPDGEL
jgi:hypothetical protein